MHFVPGVPGANNPPRTSPPAVTLEGVVVDESPNLPPPILIPQLLCGEVGQGAEDGEGVEAGGGHYRLDGEGPGQGVEAGRHLLHGGQEARVPCHPGLPLHHQVLGGEEKVGGGGGEQGQGCAWVEECGGGGVQVAEEGGQLHHLRELLLQHHLVEGVVEHEGVEGGVPAQGEQLQPGGGQMEGGGGGEAGGGGAEEGGAVAGPGEGGEVRSAL